MSYTAQLALPLTPNYFIQKVLVPETALGLIAQDLGKDLNDSTVFQNLEDSQADGTAIFPDIDSIA
jgi:hypothetical protein